jgi:polyphosphate kinase
MTRNLDGRVEVTCPIYDAEVKQQLVDTFNISWKGNVKSRFHSEKLDNKYRLRGKDPVFRAQFETYDYYRDRIEVDFDDVTVKPDPSDSELAKQLKAES